MENKYNEDVEKWTVDTEAMTFTYYGRSSRPENNASVASAKEYDTAGKVMLKEEIPKI